MYTKFKNDCERPGYTRITLCFAGFYNSLLSDRLESQIEQDAEYFGIDAGELCDAVSWGRAHTYIAKDYCGHFGEWLKAIGFEAIDFSFVALRTSKDYFQGPDTIEAEASTEALRKLFDVVMYEYESELRAYWCNRFPLKSEDMSKRESPAFMRAMQAARAGLTADQVAKVAKVPYRLALIAVRKIRAPGA